MTPQTSETAKPDQWSWAKRLVKKVIVLVALAFLVGFCQDQVVSRYSGPGHVAGFMVGMVHGALMPAALPALLVGKNVPIYAEENNGRPYKIGYIFGINIAGILFFGAAFWRPKER